MANGSRKSTRKPVRKPVQAPARRRTREQQPVGGFNRTVPLPPAGQQLGPAAALLLRNPGLIRFLARMR